MLSTIYYDIQEAIEIFFYSEKSNHQNQQANLPKDSQRLVV
jgi:hypothetical protein